MRKIVCDFCSASNPPWVYTAQPFAIDESVGNVEFIGISDEGWSACNTCKELIEHEQWIELAERSFAALMADMPQLWGLPIARQDEIRRGLKHIHSEFRKNYDGRPPFNIGSVLGEQET